MTTPLAEQLWQAYSALANERDEGNKVMTRWRAEAAWWEEKARALTDDEGQLEEEHHEWQMRRLEQ